jgi:hypothetical protein
VGNIDPMRIGFPRIHSICENTNLSVAEGAEVDWQIRLRRRMDP